MDIRWYDAYVERHDDDDVIHIYQEEIEGPQSFTVSDGVGLTELAKCDVELMEEEQGPLKKCLWKSQPIMEREKRLDACVAEVDSNANEFW